MAIQIRTRRKDWYDVTEEVAVTYVRNILKVFPHVRKQDRYLKREYLERFVRGIDLEQFI